MALTFIWSEFTVYEVIRAEESKKWLARVCEVLFTACLVMCIALVFSNPGYLKKDEKMDFVRLLETMSSTSLCPECRLIRTPRSRHCYYC